MRLCMLILTASLATTVFPSKASAIAMDATEFSETVVHTDIDLSTTEGASRLDDRIRSRINRMCFNGGRDSASRQLERECRISALQSARRQVRDAVAFARGERARLAGNIPSPASDAATPGA